MSSDFYDDGSPIKPQRSGIDFMTAMGKNRATRRRLAKASGGQKIVGSMKPYNYRKSK